ncbi:hypothetical protein CI15_07660 [Paraburkholderia monticola]|uniref:Uncharacterized protein n=1 Tax=Paraburkholderia monticola TaxID=1399968 RepID=A0A149PYH9_9BURK|nr:hypothetical protein [Paraburkholderia monticola]KXU90037.1 hypothetical protein CI15_07660 [Paraburkholderia monticola]
MFQHERLPAFLRELKAHGFAIGLVEQQRVYDLILHLHAQGAFPRDSERLCRMLAAVLSTNDEQYKHFHQRFEYFFGATHYIASKSQVDGSASLLPEGQDDDSVRRDMAMLELQRREQLASVIRMIEAAIICALLLIVLPVLLRLLSFHLEIETNFQRPEISWNWHSLVPRINWPRFDSLHAPQRILSAESLMGTGILFATFMPFAALALWAVVPAKQRRAFVGRRKVEGRPELVRLLLTSSSYSPFGRGETLRAVQALRRPVMTESAEIDIDATLDASLQNMGLFTPKYARRPLAPEYLILIERCGREDHVTHFANSLVQTLKSAQTYVDVYYFETDFRRVFRSNDAPRLAFDELCGRYAGHRLILLTNGNGMLDPVSGKIGHWALQVTLFRRRVCLTPAPPLLWGFRELVISSTLDMTVLPLLPESIPAAVEILSGEDEPRYAAFALAARGYAPEQEQALNRLADILEDRPTRWLSSAPPSEFVMAEFDTLTRDILTDDGFHWMAACAVYPELSWNLTLHVGQSLRGQDGKPVITPQRLLLLSALPWFREGSMPAWLRERLVNALTEKEYATVHEIYSKLLLTVFDFSRKTVQLDVAIDRQLPAALRQREDTNDLMKDVLLAEFMSRPPKRNRVRFGLPTKISSVLLSGRAPWVRGRAMSGAPLVEARKNGVALSATLEEAAVTSVSVSRGAHRVFGEQAGFRPVESFTDSSGEQVNLTDEYFLFLPTGGRQAKLLDQATAAHLVYRGQLVVRVALLNFVFIFVAAFAFADSILKGYQLEVAVAVVCIWIILPFLLIDSLLLRRFKPCLNEFPTFSPVEGFPHRATRFDRVDKKSKPN